MGKVSKWQKTRIQNLMRLRVSGVYYLRVRIGGREVWRSLQTCEETVARARLQRQLVTLRAAAGTIPAALTLGGCAEVYLQRCQAKGIKPRSLHYRAETIDMIRRTWPGFDDLRATRLNEGLCLEWAQRARARYSTTRYNGMIESLRGIVNVAMTAHAIERDPMANVPRLRVNLPKRWLPSREEFTALLAGFDSLKSRSRAGLYVRGLAFTGVRPDEARNASAEDFDAEKGTLLVRITKNSRPRLITLIPQAREFFDAHWQELLPAWKIYPKRSLKTVCRELGFPALRPSDFRKLFSTRLLECGVDILATAEMVGHQDRGVTLLKHYAATRPEHVRNQMRSVTI